MIDLERILTNIFNVINFARVPNCLDGKVLSNMLMSAKIPSYYFFRYSIKSGHPSQGWWHDLSYSWYSVLSVPSAFKNGRNWC